MAVASVHSQSAAELRQSTRVVFSYMPPMAHWHQRSCPVSPACCPPCLFKTTGTLPFHAEVTSGLRAGSLHSLPLVGSVQMLVAEGRVACSPPLWPAAAAASRSQLHPGLYAVSSLPEPLSCICVQLRHVPTLRPPIACIAPCARHKAGGAQHAPSSFFCPPALVLNPLQTSQSCSP